ncbi:MAG: prepilin-type N-terminal cleavage/methylation domain-containing protein [Deltaproteobacteria bacterium]|nr:prepilin-type N-terminal cleavage/methylation domain-containing protein [Deltaproteobacteria bacterium]
MLRKIVGKNELGFSLIELLIVLAIVAILASVAIPAYTSYQAQAKIKVAAENWDTAGRLAQAEIAKKNLDSTTMTTNIITSLNTGNKRNPYNTAMPAFELGAIAATNAGTVYITSSNATWAGNFQNLAAAATVTVAVNVNGNGATADKTTTLTVE